MDGQENFVLESIYIQNLGLVEELDIEFCSGITMFSGETGAGKSMLLSSLLLLMGGKATVRLGASQAVIASEWDISDNTDMQHGIQKWLQEKEIECDTHHLQIRRVIKSNGRSQCFIDGQSVSMKELSECMDFLCEVHTQHERQKLFKHTQQLQIIDKFAGIYDRVQAYALRLAQWKKKEKLFMQNIQDEQIRLREIDYLEFAIGEIETACIKKREDETLGQELQIASNRERIMDVWGEFDASMSADNNAIQILKEALKNLEILDDLQGNLSESRMRLESTVIEIEDIVATLKKESSNVEFFDKDALRVLEQRLSVLEGLKKKYGNTLEKVLHFKDESMDKITILKNFDTDRQQLEETLQYEKAQLFEEAQQIRSSRLDFSKQFADEVNMILHKLAMQNAHFYVQLEERETMQSSGIDSIEFFISSNKGEKHLPLMQIVSGGELSRIMLAIKVISSKKDSLETLVLDEVDAGIGGNTARVLGAYLHHLGKRTQVLCVTHLPIIVASADLHYKVEKYEDEERTKIKISALSKNERMREIARMISGKESETLAQQQATEFIDLYIGIAEQ